MTAPAAPRPAPAVGQIWREVDPPRDRLAAMLRGLDALLGERAEHGEG